MQKRPPLRDVPLEKRCAAARDVIRRNHSLTVEDRWDLLMLALCPPGEDDDEHDVRCADD